MTKRILVSPIFWIGIAAGIWLYCIASAHASGVGRPPLVIGPAGQQERIQTGDWLMDPGAHPYVWVPGAATSGNCVQFSGTGGAVADAGAACGAGAGFSGTYHDVTLSRAIGTIYTNSGSVPFFISVSVAQTAANGNAQLLVNGVSVSVATNNAPTTYTTVQGFADVGDTYEVTSSGAGTVNYWLERY